MREPVAVPDFARLRRVQPETPASRPRVPEQPEELLVLAARGDREAFARFYDTVIGPVWGVIRQVVRDQTRSAEIAESVFLAAWREAAAFDPAGESALAWIVARAHGAAVRGIRTPGPAPVPRPAATPEPDLPEPVGTSLLRHQFHRHLATLTQEQRDCLVLAYYQGRDCRQIAALLDLPASTVRTRLRDAMIRLRDCLGVT
ncbi:sigma-70 family RNA polymerase sigma factor [Crossiella sp. SN42]|uniref:sigma-70 family RNA polymerase sigma factor n=1 Tax=Crossiella sp. SN42 TaxID=2944808 RepID=UPI00207C6C60|nr:sigma-70 family RNA polymerase sigma factor [Crossiella sp. SN42]MCO1577254.1 sigma-70 family RNA polymerase sigma factor [Crossiella sp. SN42]